MAKTLIKSTRIHIYGGDSGEMMAYALIGFDYSLQNQNNDSCISLVRGKREEMPKLLRKFGDFTEKELNRILNLKYKKQYWADEYSLIVRIA